MNSNKKQFPLNRLAPDSREFGIIHKSVINTA